MQSKGKEGNRISLFWESCSGREDPAGKEQSKILPHVSCLVTLPWLLPLAFLAARAQDQQKYFDAHQWG